jgi:hypothetical protein
MEDVFVIDSGKETKLEFKLIQKDGSAIENGIVFVWDLYSVKNINKNPLIIRKRNISKNGEVVFSLSGDETIGLCGEYEQYIYPVMQFVSGSRSTILINP